VLRELGLDRHTLVVFTSDNGPWLTFKNEQGGSAGLLRDGKGSTWEGGLRVPGIFWWPGRIPAGRVETAMASTLDLLPTLAVLAGADLPSDRILDGFDLSPVLCDGGSGRRQVMFYYRGCTLYAVRKGPWKAHLTTRPAYGPGANTPEHHDPPLLYQLEIDPSEQYDVSADHPEVVADLLAEVQRHRATVEPVESQVDRAEAE
jgi:arylsulfatase A